MVDAIFQKDTPQILGSVCFVAITFTIIILRLTFYMDSSTHALNPLSRKRKKQCEATYE